MKVTLLKNTPNVYSCHVYLIRGDWNAISDVNTLIDVGTDGGIIADLENISTGVGKKRVEQVIITHEHFDHAGALKKIKAMYNPVIYAYSPLDGITHRAREGVRVKVGNQEAQIIYTPGHSNDSVCIYVEAEATLFSGDLPLSIKTPGGTYIKPYVEVLERFMNMDIEKVYSGHDDPVLSGAKDMIEFTLENVKKSRIIE